MFSDTNTQFVDDTLNSQLIRQEMTMNAGAQEQIIIEFERVSPIASLANAAETSACNNAECKDEFVNAYSNTSFKTVGEYTPPPEYDLEIQKVVGDCSASWTS